VKRSTGPFLANSFVEGRVAVIVLGVNLSAGVYQQLDAAGTVFDGSVVECSPAD
jgi:hypothetical protein